MAKDLSVILKETRVRLGLTAKELSQWTGLNENSIQGYEHGSYNPSIEALKKLCKALKISMDDAVDGKEYDYAQVKNPRDGCYTLVNRTKGFVVRQGERKRPYPFVKIMGSYDVKSAGIIVKEARIRQGYLQKDIAKKIGQTIPVVNYTESHLIKSDNICMREMAKVLKLSLEDVLKGIEYEYLQTKNLKDGCYTLINKTKNFVVEEGKRKEPYPFVKLVELTDLEV